MNELSKIDELLEKEAYLLDIFPKTVPPKNDNRYFQVEEIFQNNREDIDYKIVTFLMKLYCYYDFTVHLRDSIIEDPSASELLDIAYGCMKGEPSSLYNVNILLPECDAMIALNHDDLYMVLYNPDDALKSLVAQLAQGEGLFFYRAPE